MLAGEYVDAAGSPMVNVRDIHPLISIRYEGLPPNQVYCLVENRPDSITQDIERLSSYQPEWLS